MRLGVVLAEEDPWGFFHEIYNSFRQQYEVSLFKYQPFHLPVFNVRINKYLFFHQLEAFMRSQDVIFFEWASSLLAAATQLPKSSGIVTRLHRYELYEWADKINWEMVDQVILVSRAMQQEFITRFPKHASKTFVSPASISLERFAPAAKEFNGDIGILCHLIPRKRVYDLILMFYELTQKKAGFHLHIAGGRHVAYPDYFDALHNLVNDLDLNDQVTFYDHLNDAQNWYHNIDIFISNSYSEGLQVALMEAMACGCFCLSHRWKGSEEQLPAENLFFTNSELQAKILGYCELPAAQKEERRAEMRALACEKFDIHQTIAQIHQIVEEVNRNFHQHVQKV